MMTGEFSLAAVSITPFIVFDPVQLAAGRANCSALARANRSLTSAPVMTPGANSRRMLLILPMLGLGLPPSARARRGDASMSRTPSWTRTSARPRGVNSPSMVTSATGGEVGPPGREAWFGGNRLRARATSAAGTARWPTTTPAVSTTPGRPPVPARRCGPARRTVRADVRRSGRRRRGRRRRCDRRDPSVRSGRRRPRRAPCRAATRSRCGSSAGRRRPSSRRGCGSPSPSTSTRRRDVRGSAAPARRRRCPSTARVPGSTPGRRSAGPARRGRARTSRVGPRTCR